MRRVFLSIAWTALLWTALVLATGGLVFSIAGVRVSSQSPINPVLFALAASAAWMLSARGQHRLLADDVRRFAAPALAIGIAGAVLATGLTVGALVAGGSDAYGYVSQAEAWAEGRIRFDEPMIREFAGRVDRDVFVPLGYRGVGDAGAIVPMYPPGLPMVMGVFQRFAGREAVFYVVPLLAGIAILATYVMGVRLGGKAVGLAAAALLATSPSFLFQTTAAPMSDVPVTAWWAVALALGLSNHPGAALVSGLAASLAILTRPNLAPLALIPLVTMTWERFRHGAGPSQVRWMAAYVGGVLPGCLVVAMLNSTWYGSPLMSGYGALSSIYEWRNMIPNLARYPAWVAGSQTPLVLLAFAAPFLVTRLPRAARLGADAPVVTVGWLCYMLMVLALYLLYEAFNAWWFVRFMLPAFPPLLVLTAVSIVAMSSRLPALFRILVPSALVAAMACYGLDYARDHDAFRARTERKYAAAADYIARRLPQQAAVLSMLHSGSVRYYAGRPTVRFDVIPPAQLDATLAALVSSGYRPFILLEPSEAPEFRKRFTGFSSLARLDWPPIALLRQSNVRIYDPADQPAFLAGHPLLTETVP
jgi:4-amino-4-deoxy-L-arabinose transferase-like glycosyltransferase